MPESPAPLPVDPHAEASPPARRGTEVQPLDLSPEAPSLHATCIALHGVGLLLRGASGLGKSDLALRLIDGGATLVADDRTLISTAITAGGTILVAAPPPALAGLLEVRGLGLVRLPYQSLCPVQMIVDVLPPEDRPDAHSDAGFGNVLQDHLAGHPRALVEPDDRQDERRLLCEGVRC